MTRAGRQLGSAVAVAVMLGACRGPSTRAATPAGGVAAATARGSTSPAAATSSSAVTPAPAEANPEAKPAASTTAPVTRPRTTAPGTGPRPQAQPARTPVTQPPCPVNLAGQLASTQGAAQLVTVDAPSEAATTATVALWQRSGGCWVSAGGPWPARVGRNGLSPRHLEGDGTTPTGGYRIAPLVYGLAPDPGVHGGYHRVVCGDWWDEDPRSPQYNSFQHVDCGTSPAFGGGSEALWTETAASQRFAVIEYNTGPVVPGAGSGIFIHDDVGSATNGCVSLAQAQLDALLRWLQPASAPVIVIGAETEIRQF